jgi:hypothetical protein
MKVLNAHWEKRNLGVSCTEITADLADTVDDACAAIRQLGDDYVVAKVPVPRVDLLLFFQEAGYAVIEVVLRLKMRLHEVTLPRLYKRYESHLFFRQANNDDVRRIMAEIQAGVFATDRISLDPRFTPTQAANRYQHWVEDELNRGSKAYITTLKSEDIGFSILRNDGEGRFNGLFGGLYLEKKKTALGFAIGWANIMKAKELGGATIETNVATNNLAALKMNLSIGYEVADIFYVLVKHAGAPRTSTAG